MNYQNNKAREVRWGIRVVIALLFITAAVVMFGMRAEAAKKNSGAMSSKKMYQLYSNLIKKKKLKYYNGSTEQPVDVYVHDVDQDGIPEVIVGYYVFTIYNGKAVKAGCGAKFKHGSFCYWSFDDSAKQMGVSNTIDFLAAYELSEGKLVMKSSCMYGLGEQEAVWNEYVTWFQSRFSKKPQKKSCKTMDAVLKYIKKKL